MFFRLTTWELGLLIFAVIFGVTLLGLLVGRYLRKHRDTLREPFGVLQAALLGLVGLILAFGLRARRRALRVTGVPRSSTTRTRSGRRTCGRSSCPSRSGAARSPCWCTTPTRASASLAQVPGSAAQRRAIADGQRLQRRLWRLAGQALNHAPLAQRPAPLRRQPQRA